MKRKWLAVGIILLFIGSAFLPSSGQKVQKPTLPASRGNILYVGGSGPGNYTKIQTAIDHASNGDTVFVYHDSSPYYEHVFVNKSITLMGEARESTIIDGNHSGSVVVLRANNIELSGFTIQGCGTNYSNPDSGIWSYGTQLQSLKIFNNILKNNSIGVSLSYCQKISIMKNTFIGNIEGLWVVASKQIIFTENLMEHNLDAISFLDLSFSIFSYNTISDNGFGIGGGGLYRCLLFYHNIIHANTYGIMIDAITFTSFIIKNEFSNNSIGLFIGDGLGVRVKGNTFLSNDIDASFESFFLTLLVPIRIAVFRHNYWDKTTWPIPEIIRGELMSYSGYNYYYYNWFLFDWFPALYRHVIKNNHAG